MVGRFCRLLCVFVLLLLMVSVLWYRLYVFVFGGSMMLLCCVVVFVWFIRLVILVCCLGESIVGSRLVFCFGVVVFEVLEIVLVVFVEGVVIDLLFWCR